MQSKQKKELEKIQSEYEGAARHTHQQHKKKMQQFKDQLAAARQQTAEERAMWQSKLDKLELKLVSAKDRVYTEKARCRALVQKQMDETDRVGMRY